MKKIISSNLFVLFILCMIILSSCTVQKRKYMCGYEVQWNHATKNNSSQNIKSTITEEKVISSNSKIEDQLQFANESKIEAGPVSDYDSAKQVNNKKNIHTNKITHKSLIILPDSTIGNKRSASPDVSIPPEHPFALKSAFLVVFSFAFFLMALGFGLMFNWVLIACILLAEILGVLAFLFGRKARKEIKASPDKYSGSGMAKIGYLYGLWLIILTLLAPIVASAGFFLIYLVYGLIFGF